MNRQADILSGPVEERLTQANAILDERFQDKDESGYRLYNGERIHFQIVTAAGKSGFGVLFTAPVTKNRN